MVFIKWDGAPDSPRIGPFHRKTRCLESCSFIPNHQTLGRRGSLKFCKNSERQHLMACGVVNASSAEKTVPPSSPRIDPPVLRTLHDLALHTSASVPFVKYLEINQ